MYKAAEAGGAMHRVTRYIESIRFAYDHNALYIRLDFANRNGLESLEKPKLRVSVQSTRSTVLDLDINECRSGACQPGMVCCLGDVLEAGIDRSVLFEPGFGRVILQVAVLDGSDVVEQWPDSNEISFEIAPPGDELFWPTYP